MIRFILSILIFCVGLVPIYSLMPSGRSQVEEFLASTNNTVLIWGDSRTYNGLNLSLLSGELNRPVLSYATHGAGVYDFLVFADRAPSKCNALVALSFPIFLRKPKTSFNRSGQSLWALSVLLRRGFPLSTVKQLFLLNREGGNSPFHIKNTPLPDLEAPIPEVFGYEIAKDSAPFAHYYSRRIASMKDGLSKLIKKGCAVTVFEAPVASTLVTIRESSRYKDYAVWLRGFGSSLRIFRPHVPASMKNPFHDYSHLGSRGRQWFTKELVLELRAAGWDLEKPRS